MTSEHLFGRANKVIPGGVNSPVRAFQAVGGQPPYIAKAKGSRLWDVDGQEYIDYVCSWGPLILGHANPRVVDAIQKAASQGTSFGANCEQEVQMAELITRCVPGIDKVRMVNSGTEATMSAVRLARGFTGRSKVIKCAGCYHGHADSFLSQAGSGAMTFSVPDSPGVTAGTVQDTLNAHFNDEKSVEKLILENQNNVAALIVEPVAGNMGVIPPHPDFLPALRRLADEHDIVLIFDEVITGFRLGLGGAQEFYNVTPDLTTLGKIIGGGLPVGAFGGRAEIMDHIAPKGPVYQAGTLSGNPLALTAGLATLTEIQKDNFYANLQSNADALFSEMHANFKEAGFNWVANQVTSMGSFFFSDEPVTDYDSAKRSNAELYNKYVKGMLENGIYLAPSQFEATFVSSAHTDEDFDKTLKVQRKMLKSL